MEKENQKQAELPPKQVESPEFAKRLDHLEKEVKEILLSLDECLKENKKLTDLIKWGKK